MIPMNIAAALLICGIAASCTLVWRRKFRDMKPVWMGALGFFAFAGIAESLCHLLVLDAIAPFREFFAADAMRKVIYTSLAAALFEENGRRLIYSLGLGEYFGRASAVGYSVGHFSAEMLIFTVWRLLSAAPADYSTADLLISIAGRLIAACGHTALSILVWRSFREKRSVFFVLALTAHTVCDFPLGLARYGFMTETAAGVAFTILVTVLCFLAASSWQNMPKGLIIKE